ncbi:MAG: lantibiotic dehydratase C-terminal domain-containing protein [Calditrichia bacterium]
MKVWKNVNVYYSNLDKLILDCVEPTMNEKHEQIVDWFWDRHYAGGMHLRIRFKCSQNESEALIGELTDVFERFLLAHPLPAQKSYDVNRVEQMLQKEEEEYTPEDLLFRTNCVVNRPYLRFQEKYLSQESVYFLEDFYCEAKPLCLQMMRSNDQKTVSMLKLYFLTALMLGKSYPAGVVGYRSHWEGFRMQMAEQNVGVLDAIEKVFRSNKSNLEELMLVIEKQHRGEETPCDLLLESWGKLINKYRTRALELFDRGVPILPQFNSEEELDVVRNKYARQKEKSEFVERLYEDKRFFLAIKDSRSFTGNRIVLTMLYNMVGLLGLSMMEKFQLCYLAHQTVENYFQSDSLEILAANIRETIAEHTEEST